jgi:hypothetical protein
MIAAEALAAMTAARRGHGSVSEGVPEDHLIENLNREGVASDRVVAQRQRTQVPGPEANSRNPKIAAPVTLRPMSFRSRAGRDERSPMTHLEWC